MPKKVLFGPVARAAEQHRPDLVLLPYKYMVQRAKSRFEYHRNKGGWEGSWSDIHQQRFYVKEALCRFSGEVHDRNKFLVLVLEPDDLKPQDPDRPSDLFHRIDSALFVESKADVILMEEDGKSHVLRDKPKTLRLLVEAILEEAPDLIGTTSAYPIRLPYPKRGILD